MQRRGAFGAPLTHDFAVISLSDRLTPWETIEKRLTHAAKADLTIALYNPASRSRPAHLKRACDILLRDLPDSRLCGIARSIGRAGESWRPLTLGGAQRGRGRYVLHGDRRQRINEGNCGAAHHAARVQKCVRSAFSQARRRRADSWSFLSTQPVSVTACVATEYGETLLPEGGNVTVRSGRIPVDGIIQMLSDTKFDLVIDATHPYAASITESAARACAETGTEYLRLLREESDKVSDFTCVLNAEAAALFLSKMDGNILLTTGSKDLKTYSKVKDFTDRAYARVLPLDASLALCREAGVQPSHILAMQGPFSEEMDTAMLRAVSAKWLVTKDGGEAGGFAAKGRRGAKGRGKCARDRTAKAAGGEVLFAGVGQLGVPLWFPIRAECEDRRYRAGQQGCDDAGGAPRDRRGGLPHRRETHAGCRRGGQKTYAAIAPQEIADFIHAHCEYRQSAVVMSGDTGFFQRHEEAAAAAF